MIRYGLEDLVMELVQKEAERAAKEAETESDSDGKQGDLGL